MYYNTVIFGSNVESETEHKRKTQEFHSLDIQDSNYIDFEVMKKIIEIMGSDEKLNKEKLTEEIKHKYNIQTNDIIDHYINMQINLILYIIILRIL